VSRHSWILSHEAQDASIYTHPDPRAPHAFTSGHSTAGMSASGSQSGSAKKVQKTVTTAVKRQSEQLVVSFLLAASANDQATIDGMLEAGQLEVDDGDNNMRTAVHLAATHGHAALVKHLVATHGANPSPRDSIGGTPLDDAIRGHHAAAAAYLSSVSKELPSTGLYAEQLIQAAADNDVATVSMIIAAGVDCNAADYDLRSSLHLAASNGSHDVIAYLVARPGIRLSPRDRFGHTPLWDAVRSYDLVAAQALLLAGASLQKTTAQTVCSEAADNNLKFFEVLSTLGISCLMRVCCSRALSCFVLSYAVPALCFCVCAAQRPHASGRP
jgi:ankyrin repeat protein